MNGYQPTNKQVAEWKQRRAKGEAYWRIAAEYDVCRQTVSKYVNERCCNTVGKRYLEPEWWSEARKLVADGVNMTQIAKRLKKSKYGVKYALCPIRREQAAQQSLDYNKYKRKKRPNKPFRPWGWRQKRIEARSEWKMQGGDLKDFYIKHGVNDVK